MLNGKKVLGVLLFGMILLSGLSGLVSAVPLESQIDAFVTAGEPIFELVFGKVSGVTGFSNGEILFAKFLVFLLLVSIINITLKQLPGRFGDSPRFIMIVSLIVSLLAVRYLVEGSLISFIWLPYGTLAIVLSSALPFIIAFFFFQGFSSSMIRKLGWVAFAVIFGFLGYFRWDSLSAASSAFNLAWIYLVVAIAAVVLYFYDRDVHAIITSSQIQAITDERKRIHAVSIQQDIEELQGKLANPHITNDQRSAIERALRDRNKALRSLLRS